MRWFLCLVATALLPCVADDVSGPNRTTLRKTWWGSLSYDPVATGPHQFESSVDEFRIRSRNGDVKVTGSEINGYRVTCGGDLLTIRTANSDLEIRWQNQVWTWRTQNSGYVLSSTAPRETVTFERNANVVRIRGAAGEVTMTWNPGTLSLKAPGGTATVTNYLGNRTFSGLGLDQIPYLGRGLFISFHGLGILIDTSRMFPMPEVGEWNEWKPIFGRPFEAGGI